MRETQLRKASWLGLIGLMFALAAVPAALAQGKKGKAVDAAAKAASTAKVDINSATEKQLEDLPGVGPATAKKIVAGRPYTSVDDLAKAGVAKNTISKISPLVTVGAAPVPAPKPAPTAPAARPAAAPAAVQAPMKAAPAASAPFTPPPAAGMVWVNLESKVYHKEGDRWYGRTKHGKYMTEADAIKAGYRAVKEREKK